jgi:HK97 family phage portal protein
LVKGLVADPGTIITRGSTAANRANLAPAFLARIMARYAGTRLGRQEIDAEILDDIAGALWQTAMFEADAVPPRPSPTLNRIVVAIDPAATSGEQSDETGIVVAGKDQAGHGYVLDDVSGRFAPLEWARQGDRRVSQTRRRPDRRRSEQWRRDGRATIRMIDPNVPFTAVRASRGKVTRAEPVAALYEQGRMHHCGAFPLLEDQMCAFTGDFDRAAHGSPDRVDALVWAVTDLPLGGRRTNLPDFASWIRQLVEQVLVIDAPALEIRRNRGGELIGLDIVDGATIDVLIDATGRVPMPPAPAYEQVILGTPWKLLTRDQLLYLPRNPRPGRLYGFSPVEQIVMTVNTALRRQIAQLQHFTEGNIPAGLLNAPEGWSPEQIRQFQEWFDSVLAGNTAMRTRLVWAPTGVKYAAFKEPPLKDEQDEWLARVVCYAFSLPPTAFVRQVNRNTAESAQEAALREGLAPLKGWVKRLLDRGLRLQGAGAFEFAWVEEQPPAPKQQAEIIDTYTKLGIYKINEGRELLGLEPVEHGDEPMIYTGKGPVPLSRIFAKPEPDTGGDPSLPNGSGEDDDEDPAAKMSAGDIDAAAALAHPAPSPGQAAAGNYPKGHVRVHGLAITIETARGQERRGIGPDGAAWSVTMPAHYGYIRRSEGADGEQLDVYLGPDPESAIVFVVDQVDAATGQFDEHKAMLGYPSLDHALAHYRAAFSDGQGAARIGAVHRLTIAGFKSWLKDGDTARPLGGGVGKAALAA